MTKSSFLASSALCIGLVTGAVSHASAAANCVSGDRKPPYSVAWADIYLAPTWMTQTLDTMNRIADDLKKEGLVEDFQVQNANGSIPQQIQQIQAMIDADIDVIIVDAGSPAAFNRVLASACKKGIAVVSFDSPIDAKDITTKIEVSTKDWGETTAKWLIDQLAGKGKILVLNGPAGVGVSEARWAEAKKIFDTAPGIEVLAISNTEYNVAPAEQSVSSLLYAHPEIDGIWSQGGALSAGAVLAFERAGKKVPPITGEDSKQFLKLWQEKGLQAIAVGNPNWMGAMSVLAGVMAQQGQDVKSPIDVPIPVVTNDTLAATLERGKEIPDDGFVYPAYTRQSLEDIILGK